MAAAVVRQQPPAPPIATRNRGLFLPLAALHAARWTVFFHVKTLAFRSFATAVDLQSYGDVVDGTLLFTLLGKFLAGRWRLLLPAGAVYLVAHVNLGLAIDAATATAAVAAASCYSGEVPLGEAKGNLVGPMATAVFAGTVRCGLAGVVLLLILAAVYFDPIMLLLGMLLPLIARLFIFLYYDAMCAVAVVVSAAEPGMRGAGAVGRARRLMRGGRKLAQAALYSLVAYTLEKLVWKMHDAWTQSGLLLATAPLLDAVVVYLLLGGLKVLCTATATAYYFDCTRTEQEEKAGHAD